MREITSMSFSEIQPFVRYVQLLPISPGDYPVFTRPYDCRLFYVRSGCGRLYIEDETWQLTQGDLILWQTGVKYHMDSDEKDGMYFLGTNFDFSCAYKHRDYPIPPSRHDCFDESLSVEFVHISDVPAFDHPIHLHGMYSLEKPLMEMKHEFLTRKIFWREQINGYMTSILSEIARELATTRHDSNNAKYKIDAVLSYIQNHYTEELDNATIGRVFNYNPNYLNRRMQAVTGQTLHQYLISYRIQRAIEYLQSTDLPLTEIVRMTGFRDLYHFSKQFKKKTGYSPSSYRKDR